MRTQTFVTFQTKVTLLGSCFRVKGRMHPLAQTSVTAHMTLTAIVYDRAVLGRQRSGQD